MDSEKIKEILKHSLEISKELDTLRSNAFGNGKADDEGVYVFLHTKFNDEIDNRVKIIKYLSDERINVLKEDLDQFGKSLRKVSVRMHLNKSQNENFSLIKILNVILKEDVSYTPEKANQILTKHRKDFSTYQDQAERMYNIMQNFTIADLLEPNGEDKISKFSDTANALYDKLSNIWDELINLSDDHENLKSESQDIAEKYRRLYEHIWQMYSFTNKFYSIKDDLKDSELKHLTQYKKQ